MTLEEDLIKLSMQYQKNPKETFDLFYGTVRYLHTEKSLQSIPLEEKRKIVYGMVECLYDAQRNK